jgi:hypothetical protein
MQLVLSITRSGTYLPSLDFEGFVHSRSAGARIISYAPSLSLLSLKTCVFRITIRHSAALSVLRSFPLTTTSFLVYPGYLHALLPDLDFSRCPTRSRVQSKFGFADELIFDLQRHALHQIDQWHPCRDLTQARLRMGAVMLDDPTKAVVRFKKAPATPCG